MGETKNLERRFREHNNGESCHTARFAPWKLGFYLAFSDKPQAVDFETYLGLRRNKWVKTGQNQFHRPSLRARKISA
ncbi:MAG: GIY-YIG nuclease family protein [Opitutales bacterium]|nr:GIY-YIG nuclease family protein [Opitutales bacterium]